MGQDMTLLILICRFAIEMYWKNVDALSSNLCSCHMDEICLRQILLFFMSVILKNIVILMLV